MQPFQDLGGATEPSEGPVPLGGCAIPMSVRAVSSTRALDRRTPTDLQDVNCEDPVASGYSAQHVRNHPARCNSVTKGSSTWSILELDRCWTIQSSCRAKLSSRGRRPGARWGPRKTAELIAGAPDHIQGGHAAGIAHSIPHLKAVGALVLHTIEMNPVRGHFGFEECTQPYTTASWNPQTRPTDSFSTSSPKSKYDNIIRHAYAPRGGC